MKTKLASLTEFVGEPDEQDLNLVNELRGVLPGAFVILSSLFRIGLLVPLPAPRVPARVIRSPAPVGVKREVINGHAGILPRTKEKTASFRLRLTVRFKDRSQR
jgi:hypothetical protein